VVASTVTARDVELLTTAELKDLTAVFVVEAGTEMEEKELTTVAAIAEFDPLATPLETGLQNTAGV
jgi:hypothetical protein